MNEEICDESAVSGPGVSYAAAGRSRGASMAPFLVVVLAIWTALNLYAGARLLDLMPQGALEPLLALAVALLWAAYPVARILSASSRRSAPPIVEWLGGMWLGAVFLYCIFFLAADVVVGLARLGPEAADLTRLGAAAAATLLAGAAIVQGTRAPRVVEHEVRLAGLPPEADGLVVVQLSDFHLGGVLDAGWLRTLAGRVRELGADLVALTGDILDSSPAELKGFLPALAELRAPLGVWAVTGNHEFYVGLEASVAIFEAAGYRVLRDEWAEARPGLVIAGVDDLTARRQLGLGGRPLERALDGAAQSGASILLCHSPLEVEEAARLGAGLMLSGHTHGGQLWPFGGLVSLAYRYLAGRYTIGPMTLLVSRGTGTWGPRMRLPARAEILRITLRAA